MRGLKNSIWSKYFTNDSYKKDSYKNAEGKGIFQRYVESIAEEIDDGLLVFTDSIVEKLIDPDTLEERFIPYLEQEMGIDLVIGNSIANRRKVLKLFLFLVKLKGSKRGYEVAIKSMEYKDLIIYNVDVVSFFNNPLPVVGCNACYEYDVLVDGSLVILTPEIVDGLFNIAKWNEPINSVLRYFEYNDHYLISNYVTFHTQERDNRLYMDVSRLNLQEQIDAKNTYIDSQGNLQLSVPQEQFYELDNFFGKHGYCIFRKPSPDTYLPFRSKKATNVTNRGFTANWDLAPHAVKYYLNVGTKLVNNANINVDDREINELELPIGTISYNVSNLNHEDKVYFYQVFAEDSNGKRTFSEPQALMTLQTVSNISCYNASSITNNSFIANWSINPHATGYRLDVAKDNTFNTLVQTNALIDNNVNKYLVSGLATGTYYYRVRAIIHRTDSGMLKPESHSTNSNIVAVVIP